MYHFYTCTARSVCVLKTENRAVCRLIQETYNPASGLISGPYRPRLLTFIIGLNTFVNPVCQRLPVVGNQEPALVLGILNIA